MIAEFIYCYLLRPRPLRRLANGLIRALLPRSVRYGDAVVVLNPRDPVISGALFFRVYERSELAFFRDACRPGMTFLDIGANVGFYTALAARRIGPAGKIISLEPDPDSHAFLRQTIAANHAANVTALPIAAAATRGRLKLFVSSDNRGDNRLYQPDPQTGAAWQTVEVETAPADELLEQLGVERVDLIKIDVQGAEGGVIAGLERTLRRSPGLVLLTEFWPHGLRQAGTDPRAFLENLRALGLELSELTHGGHLMPLTDFDALIARHPGRRYTNLVGRKIA
jgi:FkbM family methyltransferase